MEGRAGGKKGEGGKMDSRVVNRPERLRIYMNQPHTSNLGSANVGAGVDEE